MKKLVFEIDDSVEVIRVGAISALWGLARKIIWIDADGQGVVLKDNTAMQKEATEDE